MRKNKFLAALAIAACLATSVPFSASAATPGQATDASKVVYGTVSNDDAAVLKKLFNATYYKEQNPDLAAAGITTDEALFNHFVKCGIFEGRACCAELNVAAYKSAYLDLRTAFGDDIVKYYLHFQLHGKDENRVCATVEGALKNGVKIVSAVDNTTVVATGTTAAASTSTGAAASSSSETKTETATEAKGVEGGKLEKSKGTAKVVEADKIKIIADSTFHTLEKNMTEARFNAGFGLTTSGVVVNYTNTSYATKTGAAYGFWQTPNGVKAIGDVLSVSGTEYVYLETGYDFGGVATPGDRLGLKGFYDSAANIAGTAKENKIVGLRSDYWYQDSEGTFHKKAINKEEYKVGGTGAWNIVKDDYGKDKYIHVGNFVFVRANYNDDHLVIKKDVRARESKDGLYATILDENGSSFKDGEKNVNVNVSSTNKETGVEGLKNGGRGWSTVTTDDTNKWKVVNGHAHEIVDWTEALTVDLDTFTKEFGGIYTWKTGTISKKQAESGSYFYYAKNVVYVDSTHIYYVEEDPDVYLKSNAKLLGTAKVTYNFVHIGNPADSDPRDYYYSQDLEVANGFAYFTDGSSATVGYWQDGAPEGNYEAEKIGSYTYYFKKADVDDAFTWTRSTEKITQHDVTGRFYVVDKE